MSKSRYAYAPDELDAPAPHGAPVGVHRTPRGTWSRTWPFLVVAVVFAGLAYGGVLALSLLGTDSPSASQTPSGESSTASGAPSETPSAAPSDTPSATETPSESPAADLDFGASIRVLNGSGTEGVAAAGAEVLTGADYTDVVADNYDGEPLTENVVYYASSELEATAQDVAGRFGITAVQLVPGLRAQISVVLVNDFR